MRSTDWSRTRLGPVEQWPSSLKTMLGVVLGSRFPMLLWWGPDLLHLYNDAYRPILRDKHPASLGAPAAEVWAEVWDVAGPMAQSVKDGGPATWTEDLQLFIRSREMAEETYFTFSYSPVPDDDGGIGGILNTVQETTAKVQSERQIRMLHDLTARAGEARSEEEAYRVATEVLSSYELDLPFVLIYVLDDAGDPHLAAAGPGPGAPAGGPPVDPTRGAWPFADVVRTGREVVVDDLPAHYPGVPAGRWNARPDRAMALPLFRPGQAAALAVLVAGVSPHRALDERYRMLFRATADQVSSVVANARERELETRRAEELARIDRAKTTFFSNVTHEFRTPLTLILGPIEEALASTGGSMSRPALETVHRSGQRLLRLVNSLLDVARIEAGRFQLVFVPTDLSKLTVDLASSFRSLVERAGLTLVVECEPLPEPVHVDPVQWEKVVLNLLSNAFKFTFAGTVTVRLRALPGHVELTVRDTGVGIPGPELPHVFDRFHRVEGSRGRSFEGTGIGLSLVQELVKLHGGSVTVTSEVGRGSTFAVSLPRGCAHLPPTQIADAPASAAAAGTSPFLLEASRWVEPGAGDDTSPVLPELEPASGGADDVRGPDASRVLVVDDNADMRAYLSRLLARHWRVELAEDGQAALEKARVQVPDLVLSDVMMPRLDGVGLLRELRAHPRTSGVPVVLVSARAGEEALLESLATGADDYLVKPFSARELVSRVRTHLDLARLRRRWSAELERANRELEAFSDSVAHDLRAPLRGISGFSGALLEDHADRLDDVARDYLHRIASGAKHLGDLIDALLSLSRVSRADFHRQPVDLSRIAEPVVRHLAASEPDRRAEVFIPESLPATGDPRLLRVLLDNLLGNAWKFTGKRSAARIELGLVSTGDERTYYVRDDGAGFDMAHADRLFLPFQRLHASSDFAGTGIGLATVQRIVERHDGRIWPESVPGGGATFYFTLGPA